MQDSHTVTALGRVLRLLESSAAENSYSEILVLRSFCQILGLVTSVLGLAPPGGTARNWLRLLLRGAWVAEEHRATLNQVLGELQKLEHPTLDESCRSLTRQLEHLTRLVGRGIARADARTRQPVARKRPVVSRQRFKHQGREYDFPPKQLKLLLFLQEYGEVAEGGVAEHLYVRGDRMRLRMLTDRIRNRLRVLQHQTNDALLKQRCPLRITRPPGGGFLRLEAA